LTCKETTGAILIKWWNLELIGYIFVSVTYWEWHVQSGLDPETREDVANDDSGGGRSPPRREGRKTEV
jgi:hypothetical protein